MLTPAEATKLLLATGLYMRTMFGDPACVGVVLLVAHFSDEPYLTIQELAERAVTSEDTARRRVNDLIQAGRAEFLMVHHRRCYRLAPATADQVVRGMVSRGFDVVSPAPQIATANCGRSLTAASLSG